MARIDDEAVACQGCVFLYLNKSGLARLYVSGRLESPICSGLRD